MLDVSGFQVLKRICSSLVAERGEVPASVRSAGFPQIDLHQDLSPSSLVKSHIHALDYLGSLKVGIRLCDQPLVDSRQCVADWSQGKHAHLFGALLGN